MWILPRLAIAALLLGAPLRAPAVTLGFDDLAAMGNDPGQAVPVANRLSTQLLATFGVRFASLSDFVAVVQHAPNPTPSPPNLIGGVTAAGALSYGSPIVIAFFDPTDPAIPGVTDFASIRGDQVPLSVASATMEAFDANGAPLGSISAADSVQGLTLSLAIPGIHSIRLTQDSASGSTDGTIGFDDLTFDAVQPIPEPGSLALLAVGLAALRLGRPGERT